MSDFSEYHIIVIYPFISTYRHSAFHPLFSPLLATIAFIVIFLLKEVFQKNKTFTDCKN